MADALPPLPDGFTIDAAGDASHPPLPDGFVLDSQGGAPQPDNSGSAGPFARAAGAMAGNLSAALQGTSPIVRDVAGKPNYQPLGEAFQSDTGPSYADASGGWQRIDPNQHVILNDPATGKPMVYQRSPDTNEGALTSIGRLLGFGALAPSDVAAPGLVAPVARAVTNRFAAPDNRALGRIGDAMRADAEAGGPGPQDIAQSLAAAGPPATIADVAGENVRGLAGQVARMPGPGRQQIMSTFNERDADAGTRLAQATNDMAASGPGNFLVEQALNQQAKTAAAPLYGKAYMAPPLNPDLIAPGGALDNMMSRPAMQKAALNALSIAKEEGRDPAALGITFNEAGDPAFENVPSWQTLDYVKRGLDDVLNGYRDSTTGKLVLDERGRAVDQTRRTFLSLLDANNPDYAAARAAYSGPQQSRAALQQGAQIFNKDPDQLASEVAGLAGSDQPFYQLGAANALKTALAKTSSGGDEARQLIGNAYRQAQLRAVFPNADNLIGAARNESQMFGTKQAVLGNSATAARLAQDQSGEGSGILRPLSEATTAILTHEPMLAAKSGLSAIQSLFRNGKITPEVGSKIAGYLLSSDPMTARAWMLNAFDRAMPATSQLRPATPLIDQTWQQSPMIGERARNTEIPMFKGLLGGQ